eukprot:Gregarina_sp_Poly_1__6438@NODE_343_length_9409_cov_658_993470_g287_i0_p2_GENE_NODE_343_length_9409_cov_658_993470_g287_i0NODE_343_length_9409_cov_658_993470_g287_i0_p2_ORF_typecomplete_len614_score95_45IMCp/PF12314_8/1_8e04IMCp/PF12314_8/7_9e08IMCp/PF12314_8/5_7e07IMCp/PF12314_8/1_6e03_NODE_343_length_9409_cov_658_993470_g287_i021303971
MQQRQASNESGTSSSSSSSEQQQTSAAQQPTQMTTATVVQGAHVMQGGVSETASSQYMQQRGPTQYVTSAQGSSYGQQSYTSVPAATTTYHTTGQTHMVQQHATPTATEYTTGGNTTYATTSAMPATQYTTTTTQPSMTYTPSGAYSTSQHTAGGQMMTTQYTTTNAPVQYQTGSSVSRGQSVATETSRVVGVEYGEQRVISVSQRVDESRQSVLSERYVEHEIKIPKKIVREEVIEKVIVVPEKIIHEEIVDEIQKVREKIVEVARPTIIEKIVEIPEIEYVEKIVEVPEKIVQEKIREVQQKQYQERIVEVPKVVYQEKVVEIPEIQYREVPTEKIVEVVEYKDEVIIKEVPVPRYVDKPVPNYVYVNVPVDVERKIPVPVEAEVTFEYRIPQLKAAYGRVTYPVYLPRFIEVPIAAELLSDSLTKSANNYMNQVNLLTKSATSLCEIEGLATNIMKTDFQSQLASVDLQSAVLKAWEANLINIGQTTATENTAYYGAQHSAVSMGQTAGSVAHTAGSGTHITGPVVISYHKEDTMPAGTTYQQHIVETSSHPVVTQHTQHTTQTVSSGQVATTYSSVPVTASSTPVAQQTTTVTTTTTKKSKKSHKKNHH